MAHLSLLGICKLVLVFCTAVSGLYRTCFGILSNSQWAVQNLFWYSVQQSVGCTKLVLVFCPTVSGLYKTMAQVGQADGTQLSNCFDCNEKRHFFQHQKCGTCTQFKLLNIIDKFGHVYNAMVLKREVCNQTMSSCCKHNLQRRTRRSYETFHACSPLLLLKRGVVFWNHFIYLSMCLSVCLDFVPMISPELLYLF